MWAFLSTSFWNYSALPSALRPQLPPTEFNFRIYSWLLTTWKSGIAGGLNQYRGLAELRFEDDLDEELPLSLSTQTLPWPGGCDSRADQSLTLICVIAVFLENRTTSKNYHRSFGKDWTAGWPASKDLFFSCRNCRVQRRWFSCKSAIFDWDLSGSSQSAYPSSCL